MTKRKPKGYWQNPKNFEAEMLQAIKENNGEFPIGPRLREMGKSSLGNAISTYYDGFPAVKKRMGFEVEETPDWQDEDYFLLEMRRAIKENGGKFPTLPRLREMEKSGLGNAISTYYDGFPAVKKRIGFEYTRKPNKKRIGFEYTRKPNGYWKDWDNVEGELKQIIKENNGEFPTQIELIRSGRGDLSSAVCRSPYRGLLSVKKRMGFEVEETPDWQDEDYFLLEMRKAIKENNGKFPTQRRLREVGKRGLVKAIYNFYDGFPAVKKRMGFGENDNINHLEIILTNYIGRK